MFTPRNRQHLAVQVKVNNLIHRTCTAEVRERRQLLRIVPIQRSHGVAVWTVAAVVHPRCCAHTQVLVITHRVACVVLSHIRERCCLVRKAVHSNVQELTTLVRAWGWTACCALRVVLRVAAVRKPTRTVVGSGTSSQPHHCVRCTHSDCRAVQLTLIEGDAGGGHHLCGRQQLVVVGKAADVRPCGSLLHSQGRQQQHCCKRCASAHCLHPARECASCWVQVWCGVV